MTRQVHAHPGQCRDCGRRRDVYSIARSGGGTYRRGGRSYQSSICAECVIDHLPRLDLRTSSSRFNSGTLFTIAATLPAAWPLMDAVIIQRQEQRERWAMKRLLSDAPLVGC